MSRSRRIGLDRRLDIEWLDAVAAQVAAGADEPVVRSRLFESLRHQAPGSRKPGTAHHKTVGVLVGAWVLTPPRLIAFRQRAIELLPSLSPGERLAIHWALLMAVYPFFGDVARHAGRMLSLDGSVTLANLTGRMRREWGDRSTVDRAAQRIVRSMVGWEALRDAGVRGVYEALPERILLGHNTSSLVLEGLLQYAQKPLPIDDALRHPALFPMELELRPYDLRGSDRFEIQRLGLDLDMIELRRQGGLGRRMSC